MDKKNCIFCAIKNPQFFIKAFPLLLPLTDTMKTPNWKIIDVGVTRLFPNASL